MRSILKAIVVIAFLSLFVSCDFIGKQGNRAINGQTAANSSVRADDPPVNLEQLPKPAKEYIDKYLPGHEIIRVRAYEDNVRAWLGTGEILKFDVDGHFKEIECASGIPASAIDERIINDVKSIDPDASIVKIDKDSYGDFEVKLDNGMHINYDANFKRTKFDDR